MITLRPMYSTTVRLELRVEGRAYPVAKIGPGYIVFRGSVELPPCRGEMMMEVDGEVERWDVVLKHGATPIDFKTPVVKLADAARD
jgi:hypothetical protein